MTMTMYSEEQSLLKNSSSSKTFTAPMKEYEDLTTRVIGDFGKWQLIISVLMTLLKLPIAWYQLNILFMAPPQEFWCAKPNNFQKYSEAEWRKICSPRVEEHQCLIFEPEVLLGNPYLAKNLIPLVRCKKFVYDTKDFSRTIISDWNLVCGQHWLVHVCQCVMMWGILIGGIIFAMVADKYGRRVPLMVGITLQGLTSFLASIIPWFWVFLFDWFILALASGGVGVISFVICMEVVSGKWRALIPVIFQLPFGIGNAIMAVLAYYLRDWRKLEFALAFLSSLYIFYWFWLPESPRWLIATGKMDKALEILVDAAKQNGRQVDREEVKRLLQAYNKPNANKEAPGFMAFLKSRNMRIKTLLLSMNWFCTGLAFYTFAQYLGSIGNDVFTTVLVTGLLSSVGGFTCIFVVTRVGRKIAIVVYQAITTLCFLFILLMSRYDFDSNWGVLLFAGIGFAGMAGTIPVLYLFSGELFPTLGRNIGVSGVTTFARIASMIAPAVAALESLSAELPLIIVALISFSQILMVVPLPETKDVPLPETLEEAERI